MSPVWNIWLGWRDGSGWMKSRSYFNNKSAISTNLSVSSFIVHFSCFWFGRINCSISNASWIPIVSCLSCFWFAFTIIHVICISYVHVIFLFPPFSFIIYLSWQHRLFFYPYTLISLALLANTKHPRLSSSIIINWVPSLLSYSNLFFFFFFFFSSFHRNGGLKFIVGIVMINNRFQSFWLQKQGLMIHEWLEFLLLNKLVKYESMRWQSCRRTAFNS